MICEKCNVEMTKANLLNTEIWWNKGGGVFEETARSPVSCYVCPICGHVELQANKPEVFR